MWFAFSGSIRGNGCGESCGKVVFWVGICLVCWLWKSMWKGWCLYKNEESVVWWYGGWFVEWFCEVVSECEKVDFWWYFGCNFEDFMGWFWVKNGWFLGWFWENIFRTILLIFKSVWKNTSLAFSWQKPLLHQFKPPPPLHLTKSAENCYFSNFLARLPWYSWIKQGQTKHLD